MPLMPRIRPYRSGKDTDAVLRIIRRELVPLSHNPVSREDASDRALNARLRRGRTYVADSGRGSPVEGFVHLYVRDVPQAFGAAVRILQIDMLAVRRESQGRSVGSALLEEAEMYGRGRRCSVAMLVVDEGNDRAHRFYNRAGYRAVRYLPDYRCYELRKSLTQHP